MSYRIFIEVHLCFFIETHYKYQTHSIHQLYSIALRFSRRVGCPLDIRFVDSFMLENRDNCYFYIPGHI